MPQFKADECKTFPFRFQFFVFILFIFTIFMAFLIILSDVFHLAAWD